MTALLSGKGRNYPLVMRRIFYWIITCVLALLLCPVAKANSLEEAITTIRKVGPEGAGNAAAASAWQELTAMDGTVIVPLLKSMEESSPLARNWIRSALEVVFSRSASEDPKEIPLKDIEAFLLDTGQSSQARKLAFDLIDSVDKNRAAELKPGFVNDPSPELRFGSVALLIEKGKTLFNEGRNPEAVAAFQRALDSARDANQIKAIAKQLREKAEQPLDLPKHFGFLMHWQIVGPFHNTDRKGFDTVFEPEKQVDLNAAYQGKTREVKWQPYFTTDEYGMVNFNDPYNPIKEVTAYAYTEFESDSDTAAELRLGCKNAWKIWLNGEFIFGRDEYHRGMRIDQYQLPVQLRKGKNTILVKACQDAQEQTWTKEWQFQLRVCDSTGTALLATNRKPTPKKEVPVRRRPSQQ
jgi:hypothetical protein